MSSLSTVFVALSLSLTLFLYHRALVPIYGSIPSNFLFDRILLATFLINFASRPLWKVLEQNKWIISTIIMLMAPNALYFVPVFTARWRDPQLGPALTHLAVLVPLVSSWTWFLQTLDLNLSKPIKIMFNLFAAYLCYLVVQGLKVHLWSRISLLDLVSESQFFLLLSAFYGSRWVLNLATPPVKNKKRGSKSSKTSPSNSFFSKLVQARRNQLLTVLYLALLCITYPWLSSPVLRHPSTSTYQHPSLPIQILSSIQSVTGLIVVGQALPDSKTLPTNKKAPLASVRYLRAAHSILGGVWTDKNVQVLNNSPPLVDSHGTMLGDSIYGVFVLQEAVRLVNNTNSKPSNSQNALVIGLGAGISTTALMRHGIKTSIIEIDPAVYDAARTYFGLPDPALLGGQVHLEDARGWVHAAASNSTTETYDIVVHDCFSGGGVPQHLYTVEFWEDLRKIMNPEGIVVVNFVGRILSASSRMVLHTLETSIGSCRAFHDLMGELSVEKYATEFINIVFFCAISGNRPTFRDSNPSDWLGSPLRRHILNDLPGREVDLDVVRADNTNEQLLTDALNPLNQMQEEQGGYHWKLMREVLDDMFWEIY
ncbi:spermidine synthase [Mycena floridula]|nr:spermidine synthase [Mycena floridula]